LPLRRLRSSSSYKPRRHHGIDRHLVGSGSRGVGRLGQPIIFIRQLEIGFTEIILCAVSGKCTTSFGTLPVMLGIFSRTIPY